MALKRETEIDLTELNHSELVLLANWNGLNVTRGLPRETIEYLLTNLVPNNRPDPFARDRQDLSSWMVKYWARIQMQVPKKVCPNCHECRELQVLDCFRANRENLGR